MFGRDDLGDMKWSYLFRVFRSLSVRGCVGEGGLSGVKVRPDELTGRGFLHMRQ